MIIIKEDINDNDFIDIDIELVNITPINEDSLSDKPIFTGDSFNANLYKNAKNKLKEIEKLFNTKIYKKLRGTVLNYDCTVKGRNGNNNCIVDNFISFSFYMDCVIDYKKIANLSKIYKFYNDDFKKEISEFTIRCSCHFTLKHNANLLMTNDISEANVSILDSSLNDLKLYLSNILDVRSNMYIQFWKDVDNYCKEQSIMRKNIKLNKLPEELQNEFNEISNRFNEVKVQPSNDPIFLKFKEENLDKI